MGVSTTIVKRVGGHAVAPALDELSSRLAVVTRNALDTVVRTRAIPIAADADVFRLLRPDLDLAGVERALIRERARRGGAAGLASGLPSLVIGPGTALEVAAAIGDAAAVTYAEVSMVLAIAYLRGRDLTQIEQRRLDVLLVLGVEGGIVTVKDGALHTDAERLDRGVMDDLPDEVVGRINRRLADRVILKSARRRAALITGRMLPFGIGVAVAGVEDYRSVGSAGRMARTYFDLVDSATVA